MNTARVIGLPQEDTSEPGGHLDVVRTLNGSPLAALNGQLCGLIAVDIVGFNGARRDDDIQMYVHKSLYEMLKVAFDESDVPWEGCVHEDRGDGVLVVIPPTIPVGRLVAVPGKLSLLLRLHNHVSSDAAHIQLRVAMHIGPVHHDGHGFVGHDVNLLFRLLSARSLRRMLSESDAEVVLITSVYMYYNVICRRPSLADLALFRSLRVRVKETTTQAWARTFRA